MNVLCRTLTLATTGLILAVVSCPGKSSSTPQAAAQPVHRKDAVVVGLPEFLRYPEAERLADWDVSNDSVLEAMLVVQTADSAPAVIGHYKTTLAGWKNTPVNTASSGTALGFTSPDGRQTVMLTVKAVGPGKTTISVNYVGTGPAKP